MATRSRAGGGRGLSRVVLAAALMSSYAPARDSLANGDGPGARFPPRRPAREDLGRLLFFDKITSGNRNISCATCHSPLVATTDGLSINIGTGGQGLSVLRDAGHYPPGPRDPRERGQRNMPMLFNLGAAEFTVLFHDGRISVDPSIPQGFRTVAGADLPYGFETLLEAISIFAFTEAQEMTGAPGTNEIADAAVPSPFVGVWDAVVARIRALPEYPPQFFRAFPELRGNPRRIAIVHVGKALGAFQAAAFRSDRSPFDRFLSGDQDALTARAERGRRLFYGKARCGSCHGGRFQTDHRFHAIGMPQLGPGFGGVGNDGREDFGREGVTGDPRDRYRFRTPSLRNVALTGPWGHAGAFASLEGVVRHHLDPGRSLEDYDPRQRVLPARPDLDALDLIAFVNPATTAAIKERIEIPLLRVRDREVEDLMQFLLALTDPSALDLRKEVPSRVPSGLPLAEVR